MHQSVVLGQLLQLSRAARLLWGLATREYNRLVVSSPIKNIDLRFGGPFPFPFPFPFQRFRVFQLPLWRQGSTYLETHAVSHQLAGKKTSWLPCGGFPQLLVKSWDIVQINKSNGLHSFRKLLRRG